MRKDKIVSINQKNDLPANVIPISKEEMIKVPILERFYEIDGELYYQVRGDSTPHKWNEYSHMDFN